MEQKRCAIIDIGSNSIRYLGASPEKRLVTTRLAQGLITTGMLSDAAMQRSAAVIKEYAALAKEEGLIPAAYATSAVRDAKNRDVFLQAVREETGICIDVLSGEREAEYARLGAAQEGGIVDIGGGSSQIVAEGYAQSWPAGCVRAKEWGEESGAASFDALRSALFAKFDTIYRFPRLFIPRFTGVGGTITTLAALAKGMNVYDREAVTSVTLTQETVEELARRLYETPDDERSAHPLLLERHDVIVPGALILLYIMQGMNIFELRISDADGMEGYRSYLEAK